MSVPTARKYLRAAALPSELKTPRDYRTRPKLSIADTYLASLASLSGNAPLYTFDRKLANQAESAELLS